MSVHLDSTAFQSECHSSERPSLTVYDIHGTSAHSPTNYYPGEMGQVIEWLNNYGKHMEWHGHVEGGVNKTVILHREEEIQLVAGAGNVSSQEIKS